MLSKIPEYTEYMRFFAADNFSSARNTLLGILENPKYESVIADYSKAYLLLCIGETFLREKNHQDAFAYYQRFLTADGCTPFSFYMVARSYFNHSDLLEKVEEYCVKAINVLEAYEVNDPYFGENNFTFEEYEKMISELLQKVKSGL